MSAPARPLNPGPRAMTAALSTGPVRTLLVHANPGVRAQLASLLADAPDLLIVGECGDASSAMTSVLRLTPDLVFLAAALPGADGFDTLEALAGRHSAAIVVLTTDERDAARALDLEAADCVRLPLDRVRVLHAVHRARAHLLQRRLGAETVLRPATPGRDAAPAGAERPRRFAVRSGGRVNLVPVADVEWVEAADNYVKLHTRQGALVMRETMARLEQQLDPKQFVRLHRSAIVRVDAIREVQPWFNSEYVVILGSGAKVTTGRTYRARLMELLGK